MYIFGCDIGFKQFKGINLEGDIEFKFPNIIGFPTSLEIQNATDHGETMKDLWLTYDDQTYYVGDKASEFATNHRYTFLANKVDTIDETVKLLTGLGLLYETGQNKIDLMVTGVPVEEYFLVKDKIETEFVRDYDYSFRGRKCRSTIEKVVVVPQGAGDYYDYILDESGQVITERVKPKTVIVNIGYRTTEIVTMNNGRFSRSESTTLYTATNNFHKELRRLLAKEYGIRKNLTQIDEIYRDRKVYIKGVATDISELITSAIDMHVGSIVGEIPVWVNPDDVHEILLTGGGSTGLTPFFQNQFGDIILKHDKPEFGNARGFAKYGRLIAHG